MSSYKVTLLRFGTAYVEARDEESAKTEAEKLDADQIDWNQDQVPILALYAEREEK